MTTKANYLRFFRIFGYCIAGYWLFVICPWSLHSVMNEGVGIGFFSVLFLVLYLVGIPAAVFVVSKFFGIKGLGWRIWEGIVLLSIAVLASPAVSEYLHAPADNADLLPIVIPLALYSLLFLIAISIRGKSLAAQSMAVRPEER